MLILNKEKFKAMHKGKALYQAATVEYVTIRARKFSLEVSPISGQTGGQETEVVIIDGGGDWE